MKLSDLLGFDNIVIQGHDNPDADAIAGEYALYLYFSSKGKKVRIVYGGREKAKKSNLVLMQSELNIPLEYITELNEIPELLLTVDCQYGEKNVTRFEAKNIAVIDHHMAIPEKLPELSEVRDSYGSCATVVWDMLKNEGVEPGENESLATALYYGLFMDTGKMQEIRHPKDKDMRDELEFKLNRSILILLENSNISPEELTIAGNAMSDVDYGVKNGFAIAEAERCDPNVLGIISDALIEVDSITSCVAMCSLDNGVKLSVRSCGKETRADELTKFITNGIGSGGGHMRKSGGFLVNDLLAEEYHRLTGNQTDDMASAAHELIKRRAAEYFKDQDFFYDGTDILPDMTGAKEYRKKSFPVGYVKATDMYPEGTIVSVRTLEGDMAYTVKDNTYFIIGIEGEVYKNDEDYLFSHNTMTDIPFDYKGEYAPTAHTAIQALNSEEDTEERKSLKDYAKTCYPKAGSCIYAKELKKRTKVFVSWSDSYMLGIPGDYIAARKENPKNIYIIKRDIIGKTYEEVTEDQTNG